MTKSKLLVGILITILTVPWVIQSCDEGPDPQAEILPEKFSVDIPTSMTTAENAGRTKADTLNGNVIYLNLATFIAVGSGSAKVVEQIMQAIRIHAIERVETATFTSDQDNRVKNLSVTQGVTFEGEEWGYMLLVTDAQSEVNADSGRALQVYWNRGTPVHGVAIMKPYNIDRTHSGAISNAMYRIDYDEQTADYDAQMEIRISGLPTPITERFAINALHMFAGKKGDIVDVYGNSNHPNATFFTGTRGFNWAFVAAGSDEANIAVAEVGLPVSTLETLNRTVILKDNSIKNVLTAQVKIVYPFLPDYMIANYLRNTSAPGYFSDRGFVAGGTSPGTAWNGLASRLDILPPYSPKATANLSVTFGE